MESSQVFQVQVLLLKTCYILVHLSQLGNQADTLLFFANIHILFLFQFLPNVLFLFQDPIKGTLLHSVVKSP